LVFCKVSRLRPLPGRKRAAYVGPESAAVTELLSRGLVERTEEIVVFDCGAGHKYPPPPHLPDAPVVDPDDYDPDGLLRALDARYR
jgi:hypothetical protein